MGTKLRLIGSLGKAVLAGCLHRNYIFATISYSVMLSSLSYFAKVSYTQNNIYEMLLVGSFIAILLISKEDLFSIDGLRQLK